ncbi:MAG: phosphatidylserine decarboxylase [Xanthomonadales bacterium]|nr:phosphatidylserine decarboxylase [Xanthomonadales bacterium]
MSPALVLQYILPHRLLSWTVRQVTHSRIRWLKNLLIRRIVKAYDVNMDEAAEADLDAYASFNAFFTRAMKAGARPLDPDPNAILMPADGRISQIGKIENGRIFQAKGQSFTTEELLGDAEAAAPFTDGQFATIYLSPRDYHRVHMPWSGKLRETVHIPGHLFSVAPFAVDGIPRLFARNERLVCHFDTDFGPMAVVMVGALLVSGIETVWRGPEVPPYAHRITTRDYREANIQLERGAELARFNMGSTVIVLLPDHGAPLLNQLETGTQTRQGQRLGRSGGLT